MPKHTMIPGDVRSIDRQMALDDGGAAFPREDYQTGSSPGQRGMSLRDYYAGQVIAGMFADGSSFGTVSKQADEKHLRPTVMAASIAYSVADAMIAERKK